MAIPGANGPNPLALLQIQRQQEAQKTQQTQQPPEGPPPTSPGYSAQSTFAAQQAQKPTAPSQPTSAQNAAQNVNQAQATNSLPQTEQPTQAPQVLQQVVDQKQPANQVNQQSLAQQAAAKATLPSGVPEPGSPAYQVYLRNGGAPLPVDRTKQSARARNESRTLREGSAAARETPSGVEANDGENSPEELGENRGSGGDGDLELPGDESAPEAENAAGSEPGSLSRKPGSAEEAARRLGLVSENVQADSAKRDRLKSPKKGKNVAVSSASDGGETASEAGAASSLPATKRQANLPQGWQSQLVSRWGGTEDEPWLDAEHASDTEADIAQSAAELVPPTLSQPGEALSLRGWVGAAGATSATVLPVHESRGLSTAAGARSHP